jgi:hypothetical protein
MNSNTIDGMDSEEFTKQTQTIAAELGKDAIRFFTTIHDMEQFFLIADATLARCPLTLKAFEQTAQQITTVLGAETAARFFKSIYDTLPKKTVCYLGIMVQLFELWE